MKTIDLTKGILPRKDWLLALSPFVIKYVKPLIKRLTHPEKGIKVTAKSVIDIIENGRESGVDEMDIKVEQGVGLSLKSMIQSTDDTKIDFVIGNKGVMIIHVKYK